MNNKTVDTKYNALQQQNQGLVIILEDTRKEIDRFLEKYEKLQESFTSRMDVEALSNDTLVAFGRQYARERNIPSMNWVFWHCIPESRICRR